MVVLGSARQPDRELHLGVAARHRAHVAPELLRRHGVFDQALKLHLAPGSAGLDVGQDALEIADARRQGLHLAQAAQHRLQAFGNLPE